MRTPIGSRRSLDRSLATAGLVALGLGAFVGFAPLAEAAFSGHNGSIGFVSTRNNEVGVYQINPAATNGTAAGDLAATTQLTAGATDSEPFYSEDGNTVFFSRNDGSRWAIYSVPAIGNTSSVPTELSRPAGDESHDDYAPTVTPNGKYVVFNRDDTALYTLDTTAASPATTVCNLWSPPGGLAPAQTDGSNSRAVFNPTDPSELIYEGANNHLYLITGLPTTQQPCNATNATPNVIDLSAAAVLAPGVTPPAGASWLTGSDENPDWNPAGNEIIFDSTRGGGHQLWIMTIPASPTTASTFAILPLWSNKVGSTTTATQPVFSPDGTQIAFTEPVQSNGLQVVSFSLGGPMGGNTTPIGSATDLSLGAGTSANTQSDWQPFQVGETLPESPYIALLPGIGLLVGGAVLALRRRRTAAAA